MADNQEKLLADFEFRVRQLMFICDSLKEQNISLREELKQKNEKIDSLTAEFEQLKKQHDNLKFAKSFAHSENREDIRTAKHRLSKLVQDVDKCIALLKI